MEREREREEKNTIKTRERYRIFLQKQQKPILRRTKFNERHIPQPSLAVGRSKRDKVRNINLLSGRPRWARYQFINRKLKKLSEYNGLAERKRNPYKRLNKMFPSHTSASLRQAGANDSCCSDQWGGSSLHPAPTPPHLLPGVSTPLHLPGVSTPLCGK